MRKFAVSAKQQKAKFNSVLVWYEQEKKHKICELCDVRNAHAFMTFNNESFVELCEDCAVIFRTLNELEW